MPKRAARTTAKRIENPSWLTQPATRGLDRPPVRGRLQNLPFGELEWENFERLCYRTARQTGDVERWAVLYGGRGQKQDGIDIYVRRPATSRYVCWQSKRHKMPGGLGGRAGNRNSRDRPFAALQDRPCQRAGSTRRRPDRELVLVHPLANGSIACGKIYERAPGRRPTDFPGPLLVRRRRGYRSPASPDRASFVARRHGQHPSISVSKEKLRNVRITTIPPRRLTL